MPFLKSKNGKTIKVIMKLNLNYSSKIVICGNQKNHYQFQGSKYVNIAACFLAIINEMVRFIFIE